jgi:hypothetical protein
LVHWPVGAGTLVVTVDKGLTRELGLSLVARDTALESEPEPEPELEPEPEPELEPVLHANCILPNSQVVDKVEKPLQTKLVIALTLAPENAVRGTVTV